MLCWQFWGWHKVGGYLILILYGLLIFLLIFFKLGTPFKKNFLRKILRKKQPRRRNKPAELPETSEKKSMLEKELRERIKSMNKSNLATPVTVTLLVIMFIVICNPIAIVGVGERGVKVTLGQVSPKSYTEGVHLITPFISRIKNMDVKTQKSYIETDLYTKDIQQAKISYVINYNLQPQNAHKMYREVGTNYVDNILMPVVEGTIKDVIGKWNAQDLVANRETATIDILKKLQSQLEPRYINVTGFQITDINYSGGFERAIESKVTAEQEALKAKNRTVQIQEEAKQKIISAEAEAKSMAIRANALSQNKALVEYEAVQKWDGKLPQYMMGNSIPFINMTPASRRK